ncbi:MAG: glycosyltransferase family 39 protein [Acidobacteria bacterium]|nr:glycosyltransferase family 39 protein [Acidobacteriota bacterium]
MRRPATATVLLGLVASAYCGLFVANSLIRVRTFTADSMNYVDVARRVVAGDGLVQSTGGFNQPFYMSGDLDLPSAFTAQPPGYPMAIAFLSRLGPDAADAALVVSALAYGAILALIYLLGRRIGGRPAAPIALGAALLFVPLTHLGRAALSECLAVAVVLLFFLLLDRHLERTPDHLLPPLALGLLAGAAFGVRYSLWPLPLVGMTALWFGAAAPREERREAARGLAPAFAAGALVPVAVVLGRNLSAEGRLLPPAMPAVTTLPESLERAVTAVLGGWRSTALGSWPDAALFAVVLGVLGAFAIRKARDSGRPRSLAGSRLPLLVCVWSVLYFAAVIWRSTQANFDPIGVRLALPATVPLIPVFGALAGRALSGLRRCAWLPPAILSVCFGAALVREATRTPGPWSSAANASNGCATTPFPATSSSAAARWTSPSWSPAAMPSPMRACPTRKS